MEERLKSLSARFLADRHALLAYIGALARDGHVAEDMLQEVWLRLCDADAREVNIDNLRAWSRGVARNLMLHHWRDRRDAKVVANSSQLEVLEALDRLFQEDDLCAEIWRNRRAALTRCVEELPEHSRQLIELKYEKRLSMAEIAGQISRTLAATMMSLSRVRKALEECVEKRLRQERFEGAL